MAIHVEVKDAIVSENLLRVSVVTTNDDFPGEEQYFAGEFDVTMTAAQIQSAINDSVSLLWTALGNPTWTVP